MKQPSKFNQGFIAGLGATCGIVLFFTGVIGFKEIDEQNTWLREHVGRTGYILFGLFALVVSGIMVAFKDEE